MVPIWCPYGGQSHGPHGITFPHRFVDMDPSCPSIGPILWVRRNIVYNDLNLVQDTPNSAHAGTVQAQPEASAKHCSFGKTFHPHRSLVVATKGIRMVVETSGWASNSVMLHWWQWCRRRLCRIGPYPIPGRRWGSLKYAHLIITKRTHTTTNAKLQLQNS